MKRNRAMCLFSASAVLTFAAWTMAVMPGVAATRHAAASEFSSAKKKTSEPHYYRQQQPMPPQVTPFGFYRSDPSFDPYGRPWRPNFYSSCYEDLGYGRFGSCDSF